MNSPSHRPKLIERIREAAATWGFFQVINHGVPVSVLDDTISSVRAFHDLPLEVKSKYYKRKEERGVMFASNHDLFRAGAACWRDTLQAWLGPEPPEVEEIPEVCREEVIAWGSHATAVTERLMELLSEGLGLESGKFKELSFSESKLFVGHCYPYCPQPDLTVGSGSHTDAGILGILIQNQVPGLQVKHGDVWVDVKPPLHGGLIVNVGDILQV
ncbi:hypothetical protein TIFTF001_052544 [Ficus carica]|uniref:Fe2OG dioxygenase domain-containing protein n=1 Tax=Ficus carica TaxID=3494 RepID=A0AA88EHL1_FICCA|nr:hypothetical protein TIFTF001_052544 [Ficus carica]